MSIVAEEDEVLCEYEPEYEDDFHVGPGCLVGIAIVAIPWAVTAAVAWWILCR